jgi:predicted  nucleic acid-binding Zn-ribbon protein
MADTTSTRLDRIETKLDTLTDAMISLARTEEKLSALKEDHDRAFERMNNHSAKLDNIQSQVEDNAHTVQIINKLFWAAIIAVIGSIAAQVWM